MLLQHHCGDTCQTLNQYDNANPRCRRFPISWEFERKKMWDALFRFKCALYEQCGAACQILKWYMIQYRSFSMSYDKTLSSLWCNVWVSQWSLTPVLRFTWIFFICCVHYSDVIMGAVASQITSLSIVYSTVNQAQIKENIKAPRHWPLCGEFTGDRSIPRTKGQ